MHIVPLAEQDDVIGPPSGCGRSVRRWQLLNLSRRGLFSVWITVIKFHKNVTWPIFHGAILFRTPSFLEIHANELKTAG